jgi:hypothetical protein
MTTPLLNRCVKAYWSLDGTSDMTVNNEDRIRRVVELLAAEIRNWAPSVEQARICHIMTNEIADRLLRDTKE